MNVPIFFSPSFLSFYDSAINPVIPNDAQEVSAEVRDSVLSKTHSGNFVLAYDASGAPVAALPAPLTLEATRQALTAEATATRWEIETNGITLANGLVFKTGVEHRTRVDQVISDMETEGELDVDFKAASGWVTLALTDVKELRRAMSRHVRGCFTAERQHHEAIAALKTMADAHSYDLSAGWPDPGAAAGSPET
ncbi:hypothetical protein ABID97_003019 [Variovorax sp. OAS795]|uniref:DUF4376 domain-containing protein n=1 Tax=Variovorax sp. OAS795 TaxID=3034231 RepID=UPI00339B45A1